MAGVLLWFGAQQVLHSADWIGYVPQEVVGLLPVQTQTFVIANGSVELACGVLLLLGVFTRVVAFVMTVHLAAIAFSLGNTAVGIRDWGLTAAMAGLIFMGAGAVSFDAQNTTEMS